MPEKSNASDPHSAANSGARCKHARTRLIAKDDNSEYRECLDCGELLEAGEQEGGAGFNESLSDA